MRAAPTADREANRLVGATAADGPLTELHDWTDLPIQSCAWLCELAPMGPAQKDADAHGSWG